MKLHLTRIALAVAIAAFLSSCTKTDVRQDPGPDVDGDLVPAVIHAGIGKNTTRVHDAEWDENDAIGLAMLVNGGHDIINDVYNYHYYTAAQLGVFEPHSSDMMIYFPADGSLVTFRAYYPFFPALDEDMLIPVDVSNQNILPEIDLMSADHLSGTSKRDPIVRLYFHHRLSKLIFKLSADNEGDFPSFEDATVTIRGMKTSGTYHLLEEQLEVDGGSGQNITFPMRDDDPSQRYGIVLPRTAAEGVEFDFTFPDGSVYTAKMSENLDLLGGYQYTFYINLKETAATVSAEIAEWIEAPARYYDSVQASVDAGESVNVEEGTVMDVFISGDNIDFNPLASFEYNADGKWYPDTDLYWESIKYNPAYMRSSIEMAAPLGTNQTGDWLTSEVVTVSRNTGADFYLTRAVSKVFVNLRSDQFTLEELNSAAITLPGYETGGYLEDGVFVPGTTRADIRLVADAGTRATVTSARRVALFQPQSVSAGGTIVSVNLNGRSYDVEAPAGGFTYVAGQAEQLVISLNKEGVTVSATVVNWELGDVVEFEAVRPATVAGESHNVTQGDKLDLYMYDGGTSWDYFSSYVYQADGTWDVGTPVRYWEDIPTDPAYFIARMDEAPALNGTQLPDVLLSEATAGYNNTGIDFELTHAATKVIVALTSDTFTESDMAAATITLPGYKTGGSFEGSALVPGTGTGDIMVTRTDDISGVAIFEPQDIAAGDPAVRVTFGGNTYEAVAPAGGINFPEGVATTLIVRFEKGQISISVNVVDWQTNTIELEALKINVEAGATEGVKEGEKMDVYAGGSRQLLNTYTYTQGNWTAPEGVYWENLNDPETFYASILREAAYDPATMPDDYLLSGPVTVNQPDAVNFTLRHAVARVAVRLISSDGTVTPTELAGMTVTLPAYDIGGTYDRGVFVPGTARGNVEIAKVNGENGISGLAFVQEQTVSAGTTVAVVSDAARNVSYTVVASRDVFYQAGYNTILEIDLRETAVLISARVVDWVEGPTIPMVPAPIAITGKLEENAAFFEGKTIYVYNMSDGTARLPYSYQNGSWTGSTLYWDDYYNTGLNLAAVYYPYNDYIPANIDGQTSFPWNIEADQSDGWDRRDLLMDYIPMAAGTHSYFNFNFEHVLARVRVRLRSNVFTDADLQGATVTLNNFVITGSANLLTAEAAPSGTRAASITPYTVTDGREYQAIIYPDNITAGTRVVTIKLPGYTQPFYGELENNLAFPQGYITTLDITLQLTEIQLSASVEEWTDEGGGGIIIN